MKVCFVAELPQARMGGAEVQCYLIASRLLERGHEIHYICYEKPPIAPEGFRVHYVRAGGGLKRPLQHLYSLFKALREACCDIYVETCPRPATGLVALFCKIENKIFVYRAASLKDADLNFSRSLGWPEIPWHLKLSYKFGIKAADVIVCNSFKVASGFRKLGKRVEIILNGHPIEPLNDPPEKDDTILWVARLTKVKRPELLIEIARRLPNYKFIMVGKGKYPLPKLPDNVQFLGFKTGEELKKLYRRASLLLITSSIEGFPNTLIEAGIYYTPCVTFYDPDDVVKKFKLGYAVNSVEEAVHAIREIMENPNLRTEMGVNARKYVEENHDINVTVERYEKLFYKLLQERGRWAHAKKIFFKRVHNNY